ncbi:hypothetical protein [Pseudomonas abieticivorans]|uniref:hypothetical protein n=1 Tax=Pseudomonas abieticivorans TaxID=2931382 RepID=UPI0020BE4CC4|nr:hypothetical protein [Pseudomonas sp. PIA16]
MNRCSLIVAVLLVLGGCSGVNRGPVAPPVVVPALTWQRVDADIAAASQNATAQARVFARGSMEHWRTLVYARTDENFIPWFSSYWTQEWLAMKVSWYSISAGHDQDAASTRLAVYLQDQYKDRVLAPVAVETEPDAIMAQAADFYVQLMATQLPVIAQQNAVPVDQFGQRLKRIAAIKAAPEQSASLYQLVHAQPLATQPAYAGLINQVRSGTGSDLSQAGISPVAKRTSEKLEAQFASRSAAGAVAAVTGRVVGSVISLGVAGIRAMLHESERPEMESQLRANLGGAFDQAWLRLMNNPSTGVMAGVYGLATTVEASVAALAPNCPAGTVSC